MIGFGGYNPFPLQLGGGESTIETLHRALCDRYEPGWDVSDESIKNAEAYAEALCLATVWSCNERLSKQWQPKKATDWLADWEQACDTRPLLSENAVERRSRVATKFRGAAGNTLSDIIDICASVAGDKFIEVVLTQEIDEFSYYPGVNPGPPGLEYCSNRMCLGVRLDTQSLPVGGQDELREKVYRALENVVPSWMRVVVGSDTSFEVGIDLIGATFL